MLKAAIIFSDPSYESVTLWRDRESAKAYIEGEHEKIDPNELHTGWPGFDDRVGLIDNDVEHPTLLLYLGRDDILPLTFGKYRYNESN